MDPDEGWLGANTVSGLHELLQSPYCAIGKLLVGNNIGIPVLALKGCPIWHRVKQWPERGITASVVV